MPGLVARSSIAVVAAVTATGVLLVAAPASSAQIRFAPEVEYAATDASSVALGDLDGDGDLDIVLGSGYGSSTVSVRLNDGDGSFGPVGDYPAGLLPARVSGVGDVDGDGSLDVIVEGSLSATFRVLPGDGAGGLGAPVTVAVGTVFESLAVADVDGDGRTDVLASVPDKDRLIVLLAAGGGGFAAPVAYPVAGLVASEVGDVDGDGNVDAVVRTTNSSVALLRGDGTGRLAASVAYPAEARFDSIDLADLDLDGDLHLVGLYQDDSTLSSLSVMDFAPGRGFFRVQSVETDSYSVSFVVVGDVDGDGVPDAVAIDGEVPRLFVLLGTRGRLAQPIEPDFRGADYFTSAATGDLDRDGNDDLVLTEPDRVEVLRNLADLPAPVDFAAPVYAHVADGLTDFLAVDVSGDGAPDVVTADGPRDRISLLRGARNGVLVPGGVVPVGDSPVDLAAGDVNGDGAVDVLTANNLSDDVSVLLGTGRGTLRTTSRVVVGDAPRTLLLSDVDGDGVVDLVVGGSRLEVRRGVGNGTFAAAVVARGVAGVGYLTAGDLDSDGDVDLVAVPPQYAADTTVSVLHNDGAGRFTVVQSFTSALLGEVNLGDVDSDGDLDAVGPARSQTQRFLLLPGDGTGRLGAAVDVPTEVRVTDTVVADFDGDARPDVAVGSDQFSGPVAVSLGDGRGGFYPPLSFPAGVRPSRVIAADMNRDGRVDLVSADDVSNSLSVLVNTTEQTPVDLTVLAVSEPPANLAPGGSFTVTDTTTNRGDAPAPPSTTRYLLSADPIRGPGDRLLTGARAVPALGAGESSTGTRTVTVPANVATGRYYLVACADDTSVAGDYDRANNCRTSAGTVRIGALQSDLVVTALGQPPADVIVGEPFTVTDTVTNAGGADAAASTTRYFFTHYQEADRPLEGFRSVPALPAGSSSTGTVTLTLPVGATGGYLYLRACADADGAVAEGDETNNCRTLTVGTRVDEGPYDISVGNVSAVPTTAVAGRSFRFDYYIYNNGPVAPAPTRTGYFLSADRVRDPADVAIGGQQDSAPPRQINSVSGRAILPETIPPGVYYVVACADVDDVLVEPDEDNCFIDDQPVTVVSG